MAINHSPRIAVDAYKSVFVFDVLRFLQLLSRMEKQTFMKIIQLINALTFGGAQIIVLDLAIKLRAAGHQVTVVAFRDGPLGMRLREQGFTTYILGETFLDLPGYYKLSKIVARFKPDLIHSHLFKATFWARIIAHQRRIKLVTSLHGHESIFFHKLERLTANLSDYIIFPSNYLKNWYCSNIKKLPPHKTSVIYPGVKVSKKAPPADPKKPLVIATLSRLHPVKGVDRLLHAAGILQQRGLDFRVLIGGDGKLKDELEKLATSLNIQNKCTFIGEVTDPQFFLKNAHIFVAASRQEAFGIHVCEAMERGLPVVAAQTGGLPEIIEDKVTGLLFSPENIEALADSLEMLLTDKSKRTLLSQRSRERIEKMFNRDTAVLQHLKIYEKTQSSGRIHFAISSAELGGGERLALSLIKSCRKNGWQVSATCYKGMLQQQLKKENIAHSTASKHAGGLFFALRLLADIKKFSPDMVNSHLNKASTAAGLICPLFGLPLVSHVHGLNRLSYYKNSNHLIAVSAAVKEHLANQGAQPDKISIVRNCITNQVAAPKELQSNLLKICILAKLHANKGHYWALEAILQNLACLPQLEIHLIGDGPEKARLKGLCQQLKAERLVVFHGYLDDPVKLLQQMDVALLPSKGEGIPLSLLEAMSCGLPCVATNVGGIPEIVVDNYNGFLINCNDKVSLLEALNKIRDPEVYKKLSIGALTEFQRLNNFDRMAEQTAQIFTRFMEKS
jgi:glycosyltransferase involved in cell wall biosynthesis